MPAPGDQYSGGDVKNPFEERAVPNFTAQEIATLQSRLNKQLGPEYISQRPGQGGGRVAYLEGNKAIALANEVFGFNGWSSSLGQVQIDYVDEHQNGKVSLGLSIVVRITLKDGTYHEDIGYGSIENGKGKAASFEKAKKEAATDGLKRSLRTFGNVLGNCLYDKEYLKKVQSMKVKPIKFEEGNLYRHPDFAPPPQEEQTLVKPEPHRTPSRPNQILRTRTEHLTHSTTAESADFDDEFDGNLFDGVEVSEDHGETTFDSTSSDTVGPRAIEAPRPGNGTNGTNSGRNTPVPNSGHPQPQRQAAPMGRGQGPPQQYQPNEGPGRPQPNGPNQRGPQTPQQHRPDLARPMPPPTNDIHKAPMSQQQNGQQHQQQPLRPTPQAQQANQPRPAPQVPGNASSQNNGPSPNIPAQVGFASARAAEQIQTANSAIPLNSVAFNPHAESPVPKEKRTPGLDHTRSVPVKRKEDGNAPIPQPQGIGRPANGGAAGFSRPSNFVNPQQDANRRIGMPGGGANYAMSPSANRGAYKPLSINNPAANTLKRERGALQDVTNAGPNGAVGDGGDAKRQRVEVPGAENAGVTST
ncbi:Cell death protease [Didymella heteroderae]|uniref:RAD52 homolog n=1 Tax=Didymella heteroderae TaxID=1769908 RepID=A0A9P4WN13_9PLEO|nr:Cell death protease [Didymella heteroderae]